MISKLRRILLYWTLPLMAILIAVSITVLYIYPWTVSAMARRGEIREKDRQLEMLVKKRNVLAAQDEVKLQDYFLQLEMVFPSKSRPPLILSALEATVMQSGLTLENIDYTGDKNQQVGVVLGVLGSYDKIASFLSTVEKASPILKIGGFALTVNQSSSEGEQGEQAANGFLTVELSAPFKSGPENLGSVESEVTPLTTSELQELETIKRLTPLLKPIDSTQLERVVKGKQNPFQ